MAFLIDEEYGGRDRIAHIEHYLSETLPGDISSTVPVYTTNVQTSSYTLVLADAGTIIEMNVGTANTVTVPLNSSVAFPVGTVISIFQVGAGQTSVAAAGGVTIDSPSSKLKLTGQFSSAALRKRGTDEWVLAGDISA